MWNKRNDEPSPKAPTAWPPAAQPDHHSRPAAASPATPPLAPAAPPPAPRAATAVIGASMLIKGEILSREQLVVDGEVEGSLEVQNTLTVGPNGKVRANIKAKEVIIQGSVKGNIEVTEKIAIRKNGSLVGDIRTSGIVIDDGAYFKGSIDIVKPEPGKKTKPTEVAEPQLVG